MPLDGVVSLHAGLKSRRCRRNPDSSGQLSKTTIPLLAGMKGNMNTTDKNPCAPFRLGPKLDRRRGACASSMRRQILEGMRLAVGFPDLHPGKGSPVGAAFVTEGVIYPHLIGGDIGCGMACSKPTCPARRQARPLGGIALPPRTSVGRRRAAKFSRRQDLKSTEFDADLWAPSVAATTSPRLQAVEKILDAGAFKRTGVGQGKARPARSQWLARCR